MDPITPKKRRNRAATMEKILKAAGEAFAEVGVKKAGINAIAERAGVNKVLLYRYFGGWNGLVEAFVQRGFFLSLLSERAIDALPNFPSEADQERVWFETLHQLGLELHQRPAARALIRWELEHGQTELARRLITWRNTAFTRILNRLVGTQTCTQVAPAIASLLWGGLVYAALLEESAVSLSPEKTGMTGWTGLEAGLRRLIQGLVTPVVN